ncbi:aldose 1-epimerase family protein [Clostridium saccharobutylicum]|uniref:Protein LacX, chromosomal n=1 Tax=Clostridium saccharobutylicum DSM 13864 TaxID=1345695 RepID=U5MKV2_CLOSA|nr:aldose 1-epimerase family protein [Clostridium saccharobutylicum]AGX41163.1 protein LacX, chromosomal [Clostridium saccharobutylicum DSM 13864]AQR88449.1 aldose 1-epimerase [Clostridium saccharobutylicum]AQR98347.1 aldose 1-epimerase [Clostridium saccharobutylicum]AQS08056.1 aldose 1-epimerase [Clostridium saccharobutylicum]AQS12337.1 aldose 1-epimerase [Clostridium saccharobutylicum]
MIYSLENSIIKITASTHGGEIHSITNKIDGTEYLWDGNPEYWKYHAPILFPIVGKVIDSKYKVEGKTYELPQHGLARTSEFKFISKTDNEIIFELNFSEESLKVYPYKFSLRSIYKLENNTVKVTYSVKNLDNKTIYFSIGTHPAFMYPINSTEKLEDYYLEFNEKESSNRKVLTKEGYLSYNEKECLKSTNTLMLSKELFIDDALVFDNLKSNKITIKSEKSDKSLAVEFDGFPYMGIWAPKDGAPFVCIEPWFGHADYENYNGEFSEKEGIISLDIGKEFSCTYKVTTF